MRISATENSRMIHDASREIPCLTATPVGGRIDRAYLTFSLQGHPNPVRLYDDCGHGHFGSPDRH